MSTRVPVENAPFGYVAQIAIDDDRLRYRADEPDRIDLIGIYFEHTLPDLAAFRSTAGIGPSAVELQQFERVTVGRPLAGALSGLEELSPFRPLQLQLVGGRELVRNGICVGEAEFVARPDRN